MLGGSVTHLAYDVENRVTSLTLPNNATNTFVYNGEDLRVGKVDSTGTRNYVTDGSSPASAVLSDGAAVYTPGLSEHRGGTSKFYHADALGSTRGITDAGQNVTDTQTYDAFGNSVSRTGTTPTPFGFVGASQYQTDGDSGLQLLGHRYYDPSIGRFLSSDPAKAGTNWYNYCNNSPLIHADPEGKWLILILIAVLAVDMLIHSEQGAGEGGNHGLPPSERPPWISDFIKGPVGSPGKILHAVQDADDAFYGPPVPIYIIMYPRIRNAQAGGQPSVGTINRPGARDNRRQSLRGIATASGMDRDEYPPAVVSEGGSGSDVSLIGSGDNRGSGSSVGNQMRGLPNGESVQFIPESPPSD